jgi:5-formyltetrahydrofolate cyclo-ligase
MNKPLRIVRDFMRKFLSSIADNYVFETMLNKTDLRRELLVMRSAITPRLRMQWDAMIGARLAAWLATHPVATLGVYWPIRDEPDLRNVYRELTERGIRLALPVVTGNDAALAFSAWNPGDEMGQDNFGISVPAIHRPMRPEAILVPCVGFNAQRVRLGYGGGFYDRTLALAPRPAAIGIAYACTVSTFDAAPHDIALDTILTDASMIEGE